ncbi:MAG: CHAD domain-containing protein [Actinomycetota bacterium]
MVPTPLPSPPGTIVTGASDEQGARSVAAEDKEIEWQFDAVDLRPVERWLDGWIARPSGESDGGIELPGQGIRVTPAATRRLTDTYFDTDDWRLYRAGFTLRVREGGQKAEATLKSMVPAAEGMRRRTEVTEEFPAANLESLVRSEGPVGSRVRLIVGKRLPRPLFEVRTSRRSFSLQAGGEPVGEIAVDRTTIPVVDGAEPVRLRRVEVEVGDPDQPAVASFVGELRAGGGLHEATVSKFEAGLIALGEPSPPTTELGPTEIDESLTVGEVAFAVIRHQFQVFLAKEGGTRLGEDPEELHDMRVATRRLRAAMGLFADALPARATSLRSELKWIGRSLGGVRDLDVQIELIRQWAPGEEETASRGSLADLEALLARRREEARARLLSALDSRRYERMVGSMIGMLDRGPLRRSGPGKTPVLTAAPDLILRLSRRFRKAGTKIDKRSEATEYHQVRIRGKRLRYALEFLSPVYGRPAGRLAKRLEAVQDVLGLHQDAQVAMSWLRDLALDPGSTLTPNTIFVMGRIAEHHAQEATGARTRFSKLYGKIKGKRWRDFAKLMERRRPPIRPTAARPARAEVGDSTPSSASSETTATLAAGAPARG